MSFLTKIHQLQVGDFTFQIESNVNQIHDYLDTHYQECLIPKERGNFIDYYISLKHGSLYRRLLKPQVNFYFNQLAPFNPLPLCQAHALLEWGMNWVIATQAHQYLILHAASLEKDGKGLIISAPSGSGKSTLCAYLVSQGWRLLSDEHALIDKSSIKMHGLARPINLKNRAIDVIKPYFPPANFSCVALDTHKGKISLLRPPTSSMLQSTMPVKPELLVFLSYNENAPLYIEKLNKTSALMEVIKNSFNFGLLNIAGFDCAKKLVTDSDAIYLEYSELDSCEQALSQLLKGEVCCEKIS